MSPTFSLAHLTVLQCSPPEMVIIASKAGYSFVSFRMTSVTNTEKLYPLIRDKKLLGETKACLNSTGLSVLDIELVRLDPDTEPETYLPFLETGAELGARSVITQLPDPDRQRAVDRFSRLCELAKPYNLTIDLEFPSWTEVPNLGSAVDILKASNCSNAGILIDTLHFNRSDSSLEMLKNLPDDWFHFVHLCDAPGTTPSTKEELIYTAREERYFLGEGGIDLKRILDCLPDVPYSLEIPNRKIIEQLGPEEFARQAIHTAKLFLKKFKNFD